jgi:hypothetical protein
MLTPKTITGFPHKNPSREAIAWLTGTLIDAIIVKASTGEIGDGKIFITPLERFVRIRTAKETTTRCTCIALRNHLAAGLGPACNRAMTAHFAGIAWFNRKRRIALGIVSYISSPTR